jgi:hypothetical protein
MTGERPEWAPPWATAEQIADAVASERFLSPSAGQLAELQRTAEMLAGGDARLVAGIHRALGRAWALGWRSGAAWQDRPGGPARETFSQMDGR